VYINLFLNSTGVNSGGAKTMFRLLQVLTLICVAVAMALALAHALELPGKMRLGKEAYLTVQPIYYPGFTIGAAFGEALGMLLLIVLLVATGYGSAAFWWTLASLVLLLAGHGIYWIATHPVNGFWLQDVQLTGMSASFFSILAPDPGSDWMKLRDIWEYSHVARAVCFMLSLISIAVALTL
jgi:hypothetical protein